MKSRFFYGNTAKSVAEKVRRAVNSSSDGLLSERTAPSTRAAGDAIQRLVSENLEDILGDWCREYSSSFTRRSMADIAFRDRQGFYCVIDVKTHRKDTEFNMPNLTSVKRLAKLYEDDSNIFAVLIVKYELEDLSIKAFEVNFVPIEFLDWSCLTVGALGWGQIQIANSNNLKINPGFSRKRWMMELCDRMLDFYPGEIMKIQERKQTFAEVRILWENREDTWV